MIRFFAFQVSDPTEIPRALAERQKLLRVWDQEVISVVNVGNGVYQVFYHTPKGIGEGRYVRMRVDGLERDMIVVDEDGFTDQVCFVAQHPGEVWITYQDKGVIKYPAGTKVDIL